jgi:hypothetical protein
MPDWKQIVRKNLRVLGVCSPEFTEELAAHLEDCYEALLREGLPAQMAFQRTIGQIEGRRRVWLVMRFLQEELMTGFIRRVALPGLLTSAAAASASLAFALAHIQPRIIRLADGPPLVLPLWEWCMLPICGALGALLSQHNGGSRLQRIAASLFPSAVMGTFMLLTLAVGFTLSGLENHNWWGSARWGSVGLWLLAYVGVPAVSMLLGASLAERVGKASARTPCKI